jgi:CheY-like chemotaxis protein
MGKRLSRKSARSRELPLVFVVDDNPLLAEFAEAILLSAGYRVRCFTNPAEALRAIHGTPDKPVLLVTDYDMGTMTGLELITFSRRLKPNIKTLMLSGTIEGSIIMANPVKVNKFLAKPYQPVQLTSAVRELIAR